MMEQFCIFTVMVDTQIYRRDKNGTHTHTHSTCETVEIRIIYLIPSQDPDSIWVLGESEKGL